MRSRKQMRLYQKRWHLFAVFSILIAPFLFLLVFAEAFKIPRDRLFSQLFVSLYRMVVAYLIAGSLGWLFAVVFARGKRSIIALPIFDVLQSFPTYAALPLAIVYLGESNTTVIFFLVLTMIWPIFFSIISSLKLVRKDIEEAVEIMDLRGFKYLKYYLWPISLNGLITGSIIGIGEGWEALVATEIIVGTKIGLGDFFNTYKDNIPITIFGITGFLFLIFSINKLIWLPLLEWSHKKVEE